MRNFDNSYMEIAKIWAKNSMAIRHKIGAIIVKDGRIISDGYNGTPAGFPNECEDVECIVPNGNCPKCNLTKPVSLFKRCETCEFSKLTTKREVLHAEANALTKLAKGTESSEGATLYITMSPCFDCAKLIIQSGIRRVVYDEEYRDISGIELLKKAGIEVCKIEENK